MARDIVLDVLTEAKGRGLLDAARDLDRLADKTERAKATTRDFNAEMGTARKRVHDLSIEWARTGDPKLVKDLRSARTELAQFERVAKAITPDLGSGGGKGLLAHLGELGSQLRGAMIPIGATAAAALGPTIGAAVAGAVVGGVGAGGIAGGIAAAASDPQVKAAANIFTEGFKGTFRTAGSSFVLPIIDSLGELGKAASDLHLDESFARVAPYVTEVAEAIGDMGREFMPGFNRALDRAGPGLHILAEELPKIGEAAGDMVGDIAASEGALEGLRMILKVTEFGLASVGDSVAFLSNRFSDMVDIGAEASGAMEDIVYWIPGFAKVNDYLEGLQSGAGAGQVFGGIAEGLSATASAAAMASRAAADMALAQSAVAAASQRAAGEAEREAQAYQRLDDAWNAAFGKAMGLDEAQDNLTSSMRTLSESIGDNERTLAGNSEAALTNRDALRDRLNAIEGVYTAERNAGVGVQEAGSHYLAQIDSLEKNMQALGFNRKEIDKLLAKYREVPSEVHTQAELDGIQAAREDAREYNKFLNGMDGRVVNTYVNTIYATKVDASAPYQGHAAGTLNAPTGWAWVGENGPELRKVRAGDQYMSNPTSMAAAHAAGGSGEVITIRVIHETPDGQVLREELLTHKRQRGLASLGF